MFHNSDKDIAKVIYEPIPKELTRTRLQGNQQLRYATAYVIVRLLNKAFGIGWWGFVPLKEWTEEAVPNKRGQTGSCVHCLGELRLYHDNGDGKFDPLCYTPIQAYGSKVVLGGNQDNQNLYKIAETDALKKAASYVGIASELYLNEEELSCLEDAYDDPWENEEVYKAHEPERQFIQKAIKEHNITAEEINALVKECFNDEIDDINSLLPDELTKFTAFFKEAVKDLDPDEGAEK